MNKRKTFSEAFKREAVRLLEQGDKSPSDLAIDLGIRRNQLHKWQAQIRKHGEAAFPGPGRYGDSSLI
jgi:transposase